MKTIKQKSGTAKNFFIVLFAFGTLGFGYVAFDQYQEIQGNKETINGKIDAIEQKALEMYIEIEQNLAEINAHEGVLRSDLKSEEFDLGTAPIERIQREISIISSLMDRNDHLIAGLNAKVDSQNDQLKDYSSKVSSLNQRMKAYIDKAQELAEDNHDLQEQMMLTEAENVNLGQAVDQRTVQIHQQTQIIEVQNDELKKQDRKINAAYFAVGSYNDLEDKQVLEKEGGVIGIGSTISLKDEFDVNCFTQIDRRKYKTIPVFNKKAELVTTHNPKSYEIITDHNDGIKWIEITDPELFWEKSKYMVVVTDGKAVQNIADAR